MKEDFDKILFQTTFSNFLSQVFQKQMQASKIQMDLVKKIQGKSNNIPFHLNIIKLCRKSIDSSDIILKDIRDYFHDLKIYGLYTFFETIFRIMVYNIKKISQCYMHRFQIQSSQPIKKSKHQKQSKSVQKIITSECLCNRNKMESGYRKLQILDFELVNLQLKQAEIQRKMYCLISSLSQQKLKIQSKTSSVNFQIYQEIEKAFSDISLKSENYFNSFFKVNPKQQSQLNVLCLQELQNQIFCPLKTNLKDLASKKVQKIIQMICSSYKSQYQNQIFLLQKQLQKAFKAKKTNKYIKSQKKINSNEVKKSRMHIQSRFDVNIQENLQLNLSQEQKQYSKLISNQVQLQRQQKQLLSQQLEHLKQKSKIQTFQIQQLKQNIKRLELENIKINNQKLSVQNLFKKRSLQLQETKMQMQYQLKKTIRQSSLLKIRNSPVMQSNNKKNCSNIVASPKIQSKDVQIQTESPNEFCLDSILISTDVFHQHKSFAMGRSKMKKNSSPIIQEKNKQKKLQQAQKNLKSTMQQICSFLFKNNNEEKLRQTQQIQALFKQQKYNEIILKIKSRLDQIYNNQIKKICELDQIIQQKNSNKKKKNIGKKGKISKVNHNKQPQYLSVGVQTEQKKMTKNNKNNSSLINRKNKVQKVSSINLKDEEWDSKQNKINNNETKTDRRSPRNNLASHRLSKISTMRESAQEDPDFISKLKYYNSQMQKRYSQKQNQKDVKCLNNKKFLPSNILFEQINFDKSQSRAESKRKLFLKTSNFKPKELQKDLGSTSKKNSGMNYQDSNKISLIGQTNQVSNKQIKFNIQQQMERMDSVKIESEVYIVQDPKAVQDFKHNKQMFPQKYQQLLINLLLQAKEDISLQKVTQAIERYKQSCFATRSASLYQKQVF